jgi:erythromycin esterase
MTSPKVDKNSALSVKENAREIKSLNSDNYSDLTALKEAIGEKRIVFIGESSHYVQEFNAIKVRLVKYLTKELGFKVLAFESPMAELSYYQQQPNTSPSDSILKNGIFDMWHTKDNLELITYLKENNLNLVGFDIQIRSYPLVLKYIRRELNNSIDNLLTEKLLRTDSLFMIPKPAKTKIEIEQRRELKYSLIEQYDTVLNELSKHKSKFDPAKFAVLERILKNKKYLCTVYGENYTGSLRDSLMAENLTWLIENIYKKDKIIVWAHNYHILKEYPVKVEMKRKIMGAELNNSIKNESYFIGLYCYSGNILYNGKINNIQTPHDNSLEAIVHTSGFPYTFINFSSMPDNKMNSWIYKPIEALYSGYYTKDRIILSKSFDGIIQIDSVSPSTNINYKKI